MNPRVVGVLAAGFFFLCAFGQPQESMAETAADAAPVTGLLREYWSNLPGVTVRSLTDSPDYPLKPDGVTCCPDFEISGFGENYGERLRGLLLAPVSGDYIFWIASDDASTLWLSSDDNPAHKHQIARVSLFTGARDYTRYWEQRSDPIRLEAGRRYYIEVLHKQGPSVDHLSVAWTVPGAIRTRISSQWLQPWNHGHPGEGATLEVWTNTQGVGESGSAAQTPSYITQVADCVAPAIEAVGNRRVRQRLCGYLHPPLTGAYLFQAQNCQIWLGNDDTPAVKISAGPMQVRLESGKKYYFEAFQTDINKPMSVGWLPPDGMRQTPLSASTLTPYDSDYDGIPDWYEVRHGLDPYNPADSVAVSGSNGLSNLELFRRESQTPDSNGSNNSPHILSVRQIREPAASESVRIGEKARLVGVVTYSFHNRDFYLQDGTGGIYVESRDNLDAQLAPGDAVEVDGIVANEGPSANMALTRLVMEGRGVLPMARPVALDPLYEGLMGIVDFAGSADGERVEIAGIVRAASFQDDWINGKNLVLKVITTSGQFDIRCPETGDRSLKGWTDASIRVRGVANIKPQPRSIGLIIYAPHVSDIYVETEPPSDLFTAPTRTIRSLIQYYWHDAGHRVSVEGSVLYSETARTLFIRDETGAMQVFTSQPELVQRGDRVRVTGFPAPGDNSAILTDAVFQKEGQAVTVSSRTVSPRDILNGKFNCDLVTLEGKVVDHVFSSDKQGFWLKTDDSLYDAYWSATNGFPSASDFEKDSVLKITGVATVQDSGPARGPQTFHVLLPSVGSVTILQQPPWLTSGRLFWISVVLAGSILMGTTWVMFLSKKKRLLESEVVRRERAEQDLQRAHKELEKRMTAELRDEIVRREKGEAEFQAVLDERTRIAQELHDSLEQGLVGIALQLDNVADVIRDDVVQAQEHLESARRLVEHSQAETRRSVWDLRSQSLEKGGLSSAFQTVADELGQGANVPVEVVSHGTAVPLPVLVENNLFRIGQEALTNALKHGRAHNISLVLEYQPAAVCLEVRDDGIGFDIARPAADGHHFGLQGIRERVKRLGGTLEISSKMNQGTHIRVRVPLIGAKPENLAQTDADDDSRI